MHADARTTTARPVPCNALSPAEREAILAVCNSPKYAHLPPSQIVCRGWPTSSITWPRNRLSTASCALPINSTVVVAANRHAQ